MLRDIIVDRQKTVDGITYSYNIDKGKWLSVGRCHVSYGINHRGINTSRWLSVTQGIYSNNIGFKIPKKGTIVTAILQSKNQATCRFIIRAENLVDISLDLENETSKVIELDKNFEGGVSLRCFLEIVEGNKADFPFVVLECASRL